MTPRRGMQLGLALLACLVVLAGTRTASAGFGEFTIRDELELARKFDLYIETRFPVIHDSQITGYVQSIVDRLTAAMPPQPFPIKVTVVRNGALNAFASAAGHITVFSGLIANLDSEDELASVIAHELAHVSERHIAKSIEKGQLVGAGSLLGILAGVLVGSQGGGSGADALVLGSVAGARAMQLKYTRENEKDADQYGVDFLVGAGFAPTGMASAFEKIRRLQWMAGGGDVPSYLATHPGMEDRAGYMQERIARMPKAVRERHSDNSAYERMKMLVQAWYTDPSTAYAVFSEAKSPSCPNILGQAIALSRLRRVDEAAKSFAKAMACKPGDTLWIREHGRFAFENGSLDVAARELQTAVLKDPKDLFALFYYGRAMAEKGNYQAGITAMERVARDVPRDSEVLENLGRFQAAQGRNLEAHLNYAKAFAYKRQFKKYEFHLQQSESLASTERDREMIQKVRAEIGEFREILGI